MTARPSGATLPPADPSFDIRPWLDFLAVGFGGGANVVMQLSWPEVGYGVQESVVDSGKVFLHPWKRARTTGTYLSVAVLGTDRDCEIFRREVDRVHRLVRSGDASPVRYNAFSVELQQWVGACLVLGPWDYYCKVFGRPDPWTAEQFYRHASRMATSLQVPESAWPPTFEEFWSYWEKGKQRIHIDERTRLYLEDILAARFLPFPLVLGGPLIRWLNIGFLHPEFREAMRLVWTEDDERQLRRLLRVVRWVRKVTPGLLWRLPMHLNLWDLRIRHRLGVRIV
jgi:uncharacterized protein (DUF2236 family)